MQDDLRGLIDTLIIDNAGHFSLANALAASAVARNVILLGDPQQLAQPSKAAHPEGSDVSVLAHVPVGQTTMPSDRGLFLGTIWGIYFSVCWFVFNGSLNLSPIPF